MASNQLAAHVPVPIKLAPFDEADDQGRTLNVVIETARGGRNHAEYGEDYRVLGCKGPKGAWKLVKDGVRAWTRETKRNGG